MILQKKLLIIALLLSLFSSLQAAEEQVNESVTIDYSDNKETSRKNTDPSIYGSSAALGAELQKDLYSMSYGFCYSLLRTGTNICEPGSYSYWGI